MKMPFQSTSHVPLPTTHPQPLGLVHSRGGLVAATWFVIGFSVLFTNPAMARAVELKLPLLWQTDLESLLETAATVAELRANGRDEVLVAGREELFARDGHGKALWGWRNRTRFMTYPAVLTRPGQPPLIYVADTGGVVTCLDGNGKEVWHAQLKGSSSWSASVVCDLDGDGNAEVLQTDETGVVWAFVALTGNPLWQTKVSTWNTGWFTRDAPNR
jgi:outer membrane protein assembly factor BamB